jgi:transposase
LLRHDLLASAARLDRGRRVGTVAPGPARSAQRSASNRLEASGDRQQQRSRGFWGAKTGPNPTDRAKAGSKHHLIVDGRGLPLAATVTSANTSDVTQLIPLVDAIPLVAGRPGHPRRRPQSLYADRAYHCAVRALALLSRRIEPFIAQRGDPHGSGLGRARWVVERTIAWLHAMRRLKIRYERRDDIHEAFLMLGCILICYRTLASLC